MKFNKAGILLQPDLIQAESTVTTLMNLIFFQLLSIGGIVLWAKCCYDVLVLSDVRQNIRLLILQKVDEEIEEMLDQHMPGPLGHRGKVGIVEPEDIPEQFEKPMAFLLIGVGIILGQVIHFLLSMWLFIVAKTVRTQNASQNFH